MPTFSSFAFNQRALRAKSAADIDAAVDDEGRTMLHLATLGNDELTVARLLKLGANPRLRDENGRTPVYAALAKQNFDVVKMLRDAGATFNVTDRSGNTPLMWAIRYGADVAFLQQLRTLGLEIDFRGESGAAALRAAAAADNTDVVAWLLKNRTPVDVPDAAGLTALHHASGSRAHGAMRLLLDAHADPTLRTKEIKTPLYLAAAKGDEVAADMLLEYEQVRQTLNDWRSYLEGYSPLMAAVAGNYVALAEKLVDFGAYVNDTDNKGRHSLFIAAEVSTPEMMDMLIRQGADVATAPLSGEKKMSMVHRIGNSYYKEKLRLLADAGADINAQDVNGNTPLMQAIDAHDLEKTRALLDMGANPNIANKTGRRPVDRIVEMGYHGDSHLFLSALLNAGASPDIAPSESMTYAPLHIVVRSSYGAGPAMLRMLIAHGATVDVPDRLTGATPWLLGAGTPNEAACEQLRLAGANTTIRDKNHASVIHYAAKSGATGLLTAGLQDPAFAGEVSAPDYLGNLPLTLAAKSYRSESVRALLAAGADPLAFDGEGLNALHYFARTTNDLMFPLFEKAVPDKADWNMQTLREKQTPLHLAAKGGYVTTVNRLIKLDVDLAIQDSLGNNPLMSSLVDQQPRVLEPLITAMKKKGLSFDTTNKAGLSALHIAVAPLYSPISSVTALLDAGAPVNQATPAGDTAVHIAIRNARIALVPLLAARGASLTTPNKAGQTPMDIARALNRPDVVIALQEAIAEQKRKAPTMATTASAFRFRAAAL